MKRIFVVDIGGTNSRFAMVDVHSRYSMTFINSIWLSTRGAPSFEELIDLQRKQCSDLLIEGCDALVIGIPGPVLDEGHVEMVNVPWAVDIDQLQRCYDLPTFFINDFMAQGYGCLTMPLAQQKKIKEGKTCDHFDVAVIGAGTGLGHCYLKCDGSEGYIPIPAEAGQIPFAFIGKEELAYRDFLMDNLGLPYPTGDAVVSGPGLAMLHRHLSGEDLTPDMVARKITPDDATTRWFARFYARCCRNYCLTKVSACTLLFISGGLAANYPFLVDNDSFRQEFVTSTLKSPYLDQVPIYLNTNENNGLWGAAYFGFLKLQDQSGH